MNNIYKVIWNASLSVWVAVSELARGYSRASSNILKTTSSNSSDRNKITLKCLKTDKKILTILIGFFIVHPAMAVQTISTSGSGAIVSPGATSSDITTDFNSFGNPNTPSVIGATSTYGVVIGNNSQGVSGSNVILGGNNRSTTTTSVIIGNTNYSDAPNTVLIGHRAYVSGNSAIVIGRDSVGKGNNGIVLGTASSGLAEKAIAIGHSSNASAVNSIAIGASTTTGNNLYSSTGPVASADYAIALGSAVIANGKYGIAIGDKASSSKESSVALGSSSTTATNATSENSATLNGITYNNFAGVVATGATGMQVSVGAAGKERQIKNVGSGAVSNTSTDAINGSQLYATNNVLGKVANSTKNILGGTASLGTDGTISMTNIAGTGKNTVNEALISVQNSATDANTTLANNTATALGGGAKYDAETGTWTAPSYSITNLTTGESTPVTNVGSAISALDAAVNTPLTFKDKGEGSSINKLGSEFKFIGDSNLTTAVTQGQLAISLNKTLTGLSSVETIDGTKKSTMTAAGTTVTDGTNTTVYGANGLDINDGKVSLNSAGLDVGGVTVSASGIDANNQLIKNVADGTIAENSKDALNAGQAYEIKSDLESLIADAGKSATDANTALANNTAAALGGGAQYDADTGIWTAPSYSITNLTTGESAPVTNVGAAISALDAAVNTPLTFKDAGTGTSTNKLGSEFKFIGDSNLTTAVTQGQLAISLNKTLTGLSSVETTDGTKTSTMTAAGTTVTDGTNTTIYGANGLDINDGKVSLNSAGLDVGGVTVSASGIDANNQLIKNVADAKDTGDATNLGQVENLIANASEGITNLGFSLQAEDGKAVTKKLGEAIDIVGDDQNISTVVSDNKISVVLAKDIVVDSINAGGSILNSTGLIIGNTKVTSDGIFVTGGPSLSASGISAGNKTISNVANAVNRDDAINKGQFDDAINGLSDSLGGLAQSSVMYDKNADGSVNKNSITLGGDNGTLITNLANGKVETGSKDAVNGGQLADVRDNLQGQITANTNNINEIQNNLVSGTIGLVQQQESAGQITVANHSAGTSVNFAGTSGNRVLTGVQAGRISQDSNDAVTGAQLNTNYENMANSLGGNAKFENGAWTGPSYVVGSGDDQKTVNSVGDAVNELNEADQALNTRLNGMGVQFDDALKSTNERLDKLSTKTNAAIAAAIAIASLPQPTEYGSSMLAVGTGVWEGETGLSIGASGVTTEKKIFNHKPVHYVWKFATTTNSRGHWGGGASVGIQWK